MSVYRTHDLALCAFLLLDGFHYESVERVNDNRAQMVFTDGDALRVRVQDYQSGRVAVEPRDFQRKVAFVRNRLRDATRD